MISNNMLADYFPQSQFSTDSAPCQKSNCQPTSVAMIANYYLDRTVTPAQGRTAMGLNTCGGTFPNQGAKGLTTLGVPASWGHVNETVVKTKLQQGIPVILAIVYSYITGRQDKQCTTNHAVVAIALAVQNGVSGIIVRDPDHWQTKPTSQGGAIPNHDFWPDSQWIPAFYACNGNVSGGLGWAVYPLKAKAPVVPPPPPPPPPIPAPYPYGATKLVKQWRTRAVLNVRSGPTTKDQIIRTYPNGQLFYSALTTSQGAAYTGPDGKTYTTWLGLVFSDPNVYYWCAQAWATQL